MMNARRHAIRWRAPRNGRFRRRPPNAPPLRLVASKDDDAPETLRDPSLVIENAHVQGRPAVFDALCASLEVLAAENVPCELDVVIDRGATARIYRDPDLAARLLSPFVADMPARDGLVSVGTLRIAGRRVRIYERAA